MCNMRPLVLISLLALCESSWAPMNILDQFRDGTQSWNHLITDESTKIKSFFTGHAEKVRQELDAGAAAAKDMGSGFSAYLQAQQARFNDDVTGYMETIKEGGKKVTELWSYAPKDEPGARLEWPERVLSVPARVAAHGYVCETHAVVSDGYILNVHRIPMSKTGFANGKVVLLQHGIFASSADWILNGPEKGLAYVLSTAGYDVWMPNVRGNAYSREHATLKTTSKSYWNFSWHDVAKTDMPNVIDYILKIKEHKQKPVDITYIGHSMGTSILFAMLCLRPEYNEVLSGGIALAPVVFMADMKSPLKSLAPMVANVAGMEMLYGSHEFKLRNSALGKMWSSCHGSNLDSLLCKNVIFYLCGHNEKQFDRDLLPLFLVNLGTGTSWKTVVHFAQLVLSGRFQQFDYGVEQNTRMYGTSAPPEYDLARVSLPLTLFWSQNDLLSSEADVARLVGRLPRGARSHMVKDVEFNHIDYLWARDAPTLLNSKILASLEADRGADGGPDPATPLGVVPLQK